VREEIGYPVVLKLNSETITHKSDVGGVQLNLKDEAAVRKAYEIIRDTLAERAGEGHFDGVTVQPMVKLDGYELIVGSSQDAQFGPVLLFGTGGTLVEVFRDRALALPPLNTTLARRMMEQTKIYNALKGVRGQESVDMDALESCWFVSATWSSSNVGSARSTSTRCWWDPTESWLWMHASSLCVRTSRPKT
jgi:acetyltransferase